MAASTAQTRMPDSASRTRLKPALSVAASRIVMLPRSIITIGRQQAIATAIASPPRSRTPAMGWLATQRIKQSASVMAARPISAVRPTTESARATTSAVRSSADSMMELLAGADSFDLRGGRLVQVGVAWVLGDPGLDHGIEGDAGGL